MSNASFADQLRHTADSISDTSRKDVQVLLRRAALRLANTSGIAFEPEVERALAEITMETGSNRCDLIRRIMRDWLEVNGYLPVYMLEEDGETDGNA